MLVIGYFIFNNGIPFILTWDLFGHHAYLPLLFHKGTVVAHDLGYFEAIQQQYHNSSTLYQFVSLENGDFMIKYTSGWALMMLPFYAIAELWASLGHYPKDGFSFPYKVMIALGAFTYFILAMLVWRKLLLRFFSDRMTALLMVLTAFGTNFLFMQYASLGMSHNLEFLLVALMLLLTVRFHEKPTTARGIQLGLVIGLMGLVRPPDILLALLPLGWNYSQYGGFFAKVKHFFQQHKLTLLLTVISVLIAFSPQILYWKTVAGKYFMNSYANNPGEGFDWFTPYLLEVLFSFRKGWLLYTPLMLFAIAGFFCWRKIQPGQGNIALIAFLLFLYVISCWTTWWYAESFSQRSMVDIYPLLSIGLGFFLLRIREARSRHVWHALIGLFVALNLFQTYQITNGILHDSRMTKAYYFSVFGQTTAPTEAQRALLSIDREGANKQGFHPEGFRKCFSKSVSFGNLTLSQDTIYTPAIDLQPSEITSRPYFWTICTWKYEGSVKDLEGKIFTSCALYQEDAYSWTGISIADPAFRVDTLRKEVTTQYLSPHFRTRKDRIRVAAWLQSGPDIRIRSVKIEAFEPL